MNLIRCVTSMSTRVGGDMYANRSGIRAERVGKAGLIALIDYGPEMYVSTPRVIRLLSPAEGATLINDLRESTDDGRDVAI